MVINLASFETKIYFIKKESIIFSPGHNPHKHKNSDNNPHQTKKMKVSTLN